MKFEFKNFHSSERLSRETLAFTADLWIEGKKCGTIENDGNGGSNIVRAISPEFFKNINDLEKSYDSYALYEVAMFEKAEHYHLISKVRKHFKRGIVFKFLNDINLKPYTNFNMAMINEPDVIAWVMASKIIAGHQILNTNIPKEIWIKCDKIIKETKKKG